MKKWIISILAAVSLLISGVAIGESINGSYNGNPIVRVISGGNTITDEVPAQIIDNKTMVPLTMLKKLGIDVEWNSSDYSVLISDKKINSAQVISNVVRVGGKNVRFESDGSNIVVSSDFYLQDGFNNDWNKITSVFNSLDSFDVDELRVYYYANGALYNSTSIMRSDLNDFFNHKITDQELLKKWKLSYYDNQQTSSSNNNDSQRQKLTAKDIAQLMNRVGIIVTYDANNRPYAQGSGFIISSNGLLITNYHVVNGSKGFTISLNGQSYYVNQYYFIDQTNDLFGTYINNGKSTFPYLNYRTDLPQVGDKVYAIGSPDGLTNTVSEGIVSGIRNINGQTVIQHTAFTDHGSSGGVLLNEYGEAIGITSSGIEKTQANFAIPMSYIQDELNNKK